MKMKAKLVKLTELPGGILCAQFENREGPHTIVHGTPEEFGLLNESDIGAEFEVIVRLPMAPPANAATPPAAQNEISGALPPKTESEANAGVPNPSTVAAVTLPGHVGTIGGSEGGANTEIPGAVTLAPTPKAAGKRLPRVAKPVGSGGDVEVFHVSIPPEKPADGTAAAQ